MEPDNSPRKIQFTVPLLEPHLDPEAAEQVWTGRGSGTQRRTRDRVMEPESLPAPLPGTAPLRGCTRPVYGGFPTPPPMAEPRLPVSAGPCAGCLLEPRFSLPCLGDTIPPPLATLGPLTLSQPPEFHGWVLALTARREPGRGASSVKKDTAPPLRLIRTWALSVAPKGMETAVEEL